jgi:hypothetical protein
LYLLQANVKVHCILKLCVFHTVIPNFMRGCISLQKDLAFVLVSHMDEVLQAAFTGGFATVASPHDVGPVMSKL